MRESDVLKTIAWELTSGRLNRRDLFKRAAALGLSATAFTAAVKAALVPLPALAQDLPEVPREKTLIVVRGGTQGKFTDGQSWNPWPQPAGNHQIRTQMVYEPLAFYSAFADKMIMWLAESAEYSADYMTLTIKTRSGITWSDGQPFSSEDVAYTFNHLLEIGPAVRWGADVQQFVEKAEATDANTTVFTFKVPAPRFFEFIAYKFDIGVYIVPKHIFEGQDWTTFIRLRSREGLAGHDRALEGRHASPEQQVMDRADPGGARRPVSASSRRRSATSTSPIRASRVWPPASSTTSTTSPPASSRRPSRPSSTATTRSPPGPARRRRSATSTGGRTPSTSTTRKRPTTTPTSAGRSATTSTASRSSTFAWAGASLPSTLFVPDYPGLQPFVDAVQPLIEEYPYLEFNPEKGDALLTAKGWTKDGDGMWQDADRCQGRARDHQLLRLHQRRPGRRRAVEAGRDHGDLLRAAQRLRPLLRRRLHRLPLRSRR